MAENIGLFGWPMPEPREKAGRPEHVATDENRNKIMMLMVFGLSNKEIADAIGISQPTLRKHYLQQLAERRRSRLQLDAIRYGALFEKVKTGDVPAMKELDKLLSRHDQAMLAKKVAGRDSENIRHKDADKLGKKEQRKVDAHDVGGIFAVPLPPGSKAVN